MASLGGPGNGGEAGEDVCAGVGAQAAVEGGAGGGGFVQVAAVGEEGLAAEAFGGFRQVAVDVGGGVGVGRGGICWILCGGAGRCRRISRWGGIRGRFARGLTGL